MPDAALPQPLLQAPGATRFRRVYMDPLGRPLTGVLTVSLSAIQITGHAVVLPVSVPVPLVDGVAEADLPAGTYHVGGVLRSVEREPVVVAEEIELA